MVQQRIERELFVFFCLGFGSNVGKCVCVCACSFGFG